METQQIMTFYVQQSDGQAEVGFYATGIVAEMILTGENRSGGLLGRILGCISSVGWFCTDVSGLPIGPFFKGQDVFLDIQENRWARLRSRILKLAISLCSLL